MYEVKAEPQKQRLNIKISASISEEEGVEILRLIKQEVAKLKPGFVTAIDFRGVAVFAPALNSSLEQAQRILMGAQVGKVGTLLNSNILKMQVSMVGQKTQINKTVLERFDDEAQWKKFLG
jgi:hypothetical protein